MSPCLPDGLGGTSKASWIQIESSPRAGVCIMKAAICRIFVTRPLLRVTNDMFGSPSSWGPATCWQDLKLYRAQNSPHTSPSLYSYERLYTGPLRATRSENI